MREHKKLRLSIIGWAMVLTAAMALGSCSSDETLDSIEPKAITFGGVTMENSSRATDPSYGTSKLIDQFKVWGTVTGNTNTTVNIFSGAEVTREEAAYGAAWNCNVTQYWIPSATYNFMAITNATSVTTDTAGMPTAINFDLTDGSKDLLLGEITTAGIKTVTTEADCTPSENPVAFNMSHLLSKVHFTFDGSANIVAKIKVTGHYASGTYNISGNPPGWVVDEEDIVTDEQDALNFGGIANDKTSVDARLIIPGEQIWTIKLFDSDNNQIGNSITLNYATAHNGVAATDGTTGFVFEPNTQYNINISLVDKSLSVAVQDWNSVTILNNFSEDVSVDTSDGDDGRISWNNAEALTIEGDKVAFKQGYYSASFTFKLAGPMGGTWYAMLVTQQGNPNAFEISPTQGEVGTEYTITITAKGDNNTREANMAELRFIVRQGGKILPVDCLTEFVGNYIIVQNPAIN